MSLSSKQIYEFDKFRLDAEERSLWCGEKLVPLTPKLVETLLVLVEREGRIVEKQELMERVWPDTFVEESNVARHVSLLRKTLHEWTDNGALIETFPRRGYRFSVPVRQLPTVAVATSPEVMIATHTITRITAEEETDEDETPPPPRVAALPAGAVEEASQKSGVRRWFIGGLVLVVVATALFFSLSRRSTALTEKDTLLLAEFVNRTGDPVFDGTLRQGLAVQLEQSPFLNFLSDARVRETLKLMTRPPEAALTPDTAREICVRQGLKALIRGEIAPLGSHYIITLEALAGQTGDTIARAQSEAESKEKVLAALSRAANDLRANLGESLASLQKFDALLENTTASLPALQSMTRANEFNQQGNNQEALVFLQQAVEHDPQFANAWATRAALLNFARRQQESVECARRAYALRDRATELERFRIDVWYHQHVAHDLEQALEVAQQFCRVYPRNATAHNTLAIIHINLGQFAAAEAPSRVAVRLNPAANIVHTNLADRLLRLNQLAESRDVLNQLSARGSLPPFGRELLYLHASLAEDEAALLRLYDERAGQPDEYCAWRWRAERAAYQGQPTAARAALRKAVALAGAPALRGEVAGMLAETALALAILCDNGVTPPACDIRDLTQPALALERGHYVLTQSMLALAINARRAEAETLAAELRQQFPQDTLLNVVWLPVLRALQLLHNGQPAKAVEVLQTTERYEAGARFLPQYLRAQAWLQLRDGAAAAAAFEKIRAQRSVTPNSPLYPLAHLGLARAAALSGDLEKSRQAYGEFFKLWQQAEENLPILRAAQQEYANLK